MRTPLGSLRIPLDPFGNILWLAILSAERLDEGSDFVRRMVALGSVCAMWDDAFPTCPDSLP
jgi:hypothetical protein